MVICHRYNIDIHITQCIGNSRRRAECRVTRVWAFIGEGGFKIDYRQIGILKIWSNILKRSGVVVSAITAQSRRKLRGVLHQIASRNNSRTTYLDARLCRTRLLLWRIRHKTKRQRYRRHHCNYSQQSFQFCTHNFLKNKKNYSLRKTTIAFRHK